MQCVIYKGRKKQDSYLYVERENDFARVPQPLLEMLGKLEWVMSLDLSDREHLAQVDSQQLVRLLKEQGYFLQLPPRIETLQ